MACMAAMTNMSAMIMVACMRLMAAVIMMRRGLVCLRMPVVIMTSVMLGHIACLGGNRVIVFHRDLRILIPPRGMSYSL